MACCHVYAPIKSLRTSLPGELRLAPHAPSPGWHALYLLLLLCFYAGLAALERAHICSPVLSHHLRKPQNRLDQRHERNSFAGSSNVELACQTNTAGVAAPLGFLPAVLRLSRSCGELLTLHGCTLSPLACCSLPPRTCGERFIALLRLWPAVLHLPWSCGERFTLHSFASGLLFLIFQVLW